MALYEIQAAEGYKGNGIMEGVREALNTEGYLAHPIQGDGNGTPDMIKTQSDVDPLSMGRVIKRTSGVHRLKPVFC